MPSVMNANGTMLSVSPDMGSVPGSLCGQSEVLKQVMGVIEKKARNMEKKKVSPVSLQGRQPWIYSPQLLCPTAIHHQLPVS